MMINQNNKPKKKQNKFKLNMPKINKKLLPH